MEKKDNFIKRYNYVKDDIIKRLDEAYAVEMIQFAVKYGVNQLNIKMIIEFGTITRVITEQNNIMKEQ